MSLTSLYLCVAISLPFYVSLCVVSLSLSLFLCPSLCVSLFILLPSYYDSLFSLTFSDIIYSLSAYLCVSLTLCVCLSVCVHLYVSLSV